MEQHLATLNDLKRLRTLKLAQARMHTLLGVGGDAAWVNEERAEGQTQHALLRAEARARMRESRSSARKVGLSISFKLGSSSDGVRVTLPYPLHKVRAMRVVGGAVPHPLYTSFRAGYDDRISVTYTQRWDIPRVRVRASAATTTTVTVIDSKKTLNRRLVIRPEVVPGAAGTAQTCFAQASVQAPAIALEGVLDAQLVGLMSRPFVILVGPTTAVAPSGTRYSLTVANKYQVHLACNYKPFETESYVIFRSTGRNFSASWLVDGDYLNPAVNAPHFDLVAEYQETHPASAGVASFIQTLEAGGGVTLLRGDDGASEKLSIERVGKAVIQLEPSTLTVDEAAFVLEAAIAKYSRLLELGDAASKSSADFFRIGCYGERLSFLLDPPSTAAATQVAFLFGSADLMDRDRQATLALGYTTETDVIFARGIAQVAPAPYMHHRIGRTVRVDCEETASRVGGGQAPPAWFEYGAHDDISSSPDQRTIHLGGGRVYGSIDCSPELSILDTLTLDISVHEAGIGSNGAAEEQRHDIHADPHSTYSLALEVDVAPTT